MKERIGQVWELRTSAVHLFYLVVGTGKWRGVDHNNSATVMWVHPCLNLHTGEQFEATEWSDDLWENREIYTKHE